MSHRPPDDVVSDGPIRPLPKRRRSGTGGALLAGVGVLLAVVAVFVFVLRGVAVPVDVGPGPISDTETASPETTFGITNEGETLATSETTGPGPGSFSIGQLKLGLLTTDDLPNGWTIGEDSTDSESGMDLPCNVRFGWSPDSSSTQALGRYHAANGSSDVQHTVWALDEWVAADLFELAAMATAGCVESWTQPPGEGNERGLDVAVIPSPPITSRGNETVVSTVVDVSTDGEGSQIVTVLTRCGGLVSRLGLSTTPTADGNVPGNLRRWPGSKRLRSPRRGCRVGKRHLPAGLTGRPGWIAPGRARHVRARGKDIRFSPSANAVAVPAARLR